MSETKPIPPIVPTYYVRHPDGSFSVAQSPRPTEDQISAQRVTYAQCDRQHGGGACEDLYCYRARTLTFDEWWGASKFKFDAGKEIAQKAWDAALGARHVER